MCPCRMKSVPHNFRGRKEPVKLFSDWMEALKEEIYTGVRGLYLMLLFMPVIMLSPLCVGLGWGWSSWVELVRWSLERAGPAFIKWGQVQDPISDAENPHAACSSAVQQPDFTDV